MTELQRLRLAKGLEPAQLAKASGLNLPSYYDAENYPDELMTVVDIVSTLKLAKFLAVLPTQILDHSDVDGSESPRPLFEYLWKKAAISPHGLTQLEDIVGWSVTPLSDDYLTFLEAMLSWSPHQLSDLCQEAGIDWRLILNGLYAEREVRG